MKRTEAISTVVPKVGSITVGRVMEAIKDVPEILAYLPDLEGLKPKHMNRQYLFDIVNTLEPSYF